MAWLKAKIKNLYMDSRLWLEKKEKKSMVYIGLYIYGVARSKSKFTQHCCNSIILLLTSILWSITIIGRSADNPDGYFDQYCIANISIEMETNETASKNMEHIYKHWTELEFIGMAESLWCKKGLKGR
jgi:hypothetical protein